MNNGDERLIDLLNDCDIDAGLTTTAADLSHTLNCSEKTVRRILGRLTAAGHVEVIHRVGQGMVIRLVRGEVSRVSRLDTDTHPPTGGVGGVQSRLDTPGTSPRRTVEKRKDPPPDPDCERCEGTGWQFLDVPANTVIACECADRPDGVSAHTPPGPTTTCRRR